MDGEGGTIPGRDHALFLLRAGEECITSDTGLTSVQCLTFLARLNPRRIYLWYFGDYDVTKILEDLPEGKLRRLMNRQARTPCRGGRPFPVDVHGERFQIDYLPRKFFKARERIKKGVYTPWITVSDVGTFFQCPFADALEKWEIGTAEQIAAIRAGKAHRNAFDVRELPDIDKYNHLECVLLAEMMEKFRRTCKRAGYVPRAWQGPGQIAEAVFRARGIPKAKTLLPRIPWGVMDFAGKAFYGGRPEITQLGPVPGPVYQADINGAYPFAMLSVPCLEHGEWTHGTSRAADTMALVYGSFQRKLPRRGARTAPRLWGLPVRRPDGGIYYPAAGRGWYWSFEVAAATHQDFRTEEAWVYHRRCDCRPFHFNTGLYEMRKRLGKDALGHFLKLAVNSEYGKLAQSIGSPVYANPVLASYITAHCRTTIQALIHSLPAHKRGECGRDVVMIATDAIFTTAPIPVQASTELGGLEIKVHDNGLFLVQPGLYFTGDGSKPKTRGVPRTAVMEHENAFHEAWERMCDSGDEADGVVDIPVNTFIGIRQALHRNRPDLAGKWIEYREDGTRNGKRIGFQWRSKRAALVPPLPGTYGAAETYPHEGDPAIESVPYSKEIGQWRNEMRMPFEDQPDWATSLGMENEE